MRILWNRQKRMSKVMRKENFNHYVGNITPSDDTIFVFGSNYEGRHGAGAAKVAMRQFGAIYGQGRGIQGHAYGLITTDVKTRVRPSVSRDEIILYKIAARKMRGLQPRL